MRINTYFRTYTPTWAEGNRVFLKMLLHRTDSNPLNFCPFSLKLIYNE